MEKVNIYKRQLTKNGHQYLCMRKQCYLLEGSVIARLSKMTSVCLHLNLITIGRVPEFVKAVVQNAIDVAQFGQLLVYFPRFLRP